MQHSQARRTKQICQVVFRDVAQETYPPIVSDISRDAMNIARGLWMVASCNHQLRGRQLRHYSFVRGDQRLKPLIGAPFAEREDPMDRVPAQRKVRWFWPAGKDSVMSDVDPTALILLTQCLVIRG